MLAAVGACQHDPDRFLPTAPGFSGSLVLSVSATSLPADGFSRLEIVARIDPEADADKRTVVFTTTAGTFVGADPADMRTMRVDADTAGEAKVQLQSSTQVETAVVEAAIDGVDGLTKRISIEFTAPAPETLVLTASADSVPADGFSRVELLAQIDPSNPPDKRTVKFSASMGELIGANRDAEGNVLVTADLSGLARAELRSSQVPGAAVVEAALEGVPGAFQRIEIEFTPVDPEDIIRISTATSSAPADGATLTAVFADISPSLPAAQRQVRFETNLGTFAGDSTVNADASNRATVDLRSPGTIGQARLRATVASTTAQTFLDFVRAFPDRLVVKPDDFTFDVSSDTELDVTVELERDVGSVTDGTEVSYSIVKASDGMPVPDVEFRGITSSDGGQSTATLVKLSGGAPPTGFAIIRVTSGGASGEETIEFVP